VHQELMLRPWPTCAHVCPAKVTELISFPRLREDVEGFKSGEPHVRMELPDALKGVLRTRNATRNQSESVWDLICRGYHIRHLEDEVRALVQGSAQPQRREPRPNQVAHNPTHLPIAAASQESRSKM